MFAFIEKVVFSIALVLIPHLFFIEKGNICSVRDNRYWFMLLAVFLHEIVRSVSESKDVQRRVYIEGCTRNKWAFRGPLLSQVFRAFWALLKIDQFRCVGIACYRAGGSAKQGLWYRLTETYPLGSFH